MADSPRRCTVRQKFSVSGPAAQCELTRPKSPTIPGDSFLRGLYCGLSNSAECVAMKLACWSVMLAVLVVASLPQSSCGQDASDSEVQAESGRQSGRRGRGAPRYRSDLTLRDFRAHDPFIVAYAPEQTYYLYSGTRGDRGRAGVVAYKS